MATLGGAFPRSSINRNHSVAADVRQRRQRMLDNLSPTYESDTDSDYSYLDRSSIDSNYGSVYGRHEPPTPRNRMQIESRSGCQGHSEAENRRGFLDRIRGRPEGRGAGRPDGLNLQRSSSYHARQPEHSSPRDWRNMFDRRPGEDPSRYEALRGLRDTTREVQEELDRLREARENGFRSRDRPPHRRSSPPPALRPPPRHTRRPSIGERGGRNERYGRQAESNDRSVFHDIEDRARQFGQSGTRGRSISPPPLRRNATTPRSQPPWQDRRPDGRWGWPSNVYVPGPLTRTRQDRAVVDDIVASHIRNNTLTRHHYMILWSPDYGLNNPDDIDVAVTIIDDTFNFREAGNIAAFYRVNNLREDDPRVQTQHHHYDRSALAAVVVAQDAQLSQHGISDDYDDAGFGSIRADDDMEQRYQETMAELYTMRQYIQELRIGAADARGVESQRLAALPSRQLTAADKGEDGPMSCPVCIEEKNVGDTVVELPCKHWFDKECIETWLKDHTNCPSCRAPVA